jgi:hypothetical protein
MVRRVIEEERCQIWIESALKKIIESASRSTGLLVVCRKYVLGNEELRRI